MYLRSKITPILQNTRIYPVGLALVIVTALVACGDGPDENQVAVEAFLKQQVEERILTYRQILTQQCRDNVLEEAGKIADSILIAEARLQRDSMNKPPKPLKPDRPELKKLKDSLKLDPLFRDTITN
ncbi:hypothetical protein [Flavilitoribacter nigricans]|uniref:Lipoprotein n=1 Tax=Flavilitoribacter nigricans (strain ATCC 23147 / DSM 23189 / NBRC 102662 / NCIMB 1420 / SS-2) TaxID=1122177 RepID=A0A2D0NI49_FLAN2|nr:hypothetical protein [Flavilitoribacter nigricans]PHN07433.1 hypothetical protein CRP01_07340 [Flavilitoribacter nigricans DSM 23189 = NBRC 102662]